ncbi:MAG: tRNA threonylcarbamoyladenosine dehydratase [Atopobiaceae bacterium]|nr:tRNA threonylcarbamoyladenosine dehydratase [Atopobiaceae bacterium]MBR1830104.1 tRNA threonylcarbamoyladenosine dehydratase [Atopobiaceae bacterium]
METATDRLRLILGDEGLALLQDATVMVLGLGGVGSSCAEALARGGVGHLVLVDRDVVAPSNINRQALAFVSTIGRPKAEVMAEMVADINPACEVTAVQAFIDKDRIAEQLSALPRPDYVIDAIDTISQKLRIAQWCQDEGLRLVSAMGGANKLDPTRLRFSRIEKTQIDPIARVMRKECRKRGIKDLMVLWSDEEPREALGKRDAIDERGFVREGASILGTMSYFPPIMGQMLASYAIRQIVGL